MPTHLPESVLIKARIFGKALNALAVVSPSVAGRLAFRFFCTPRSLPFREKDRAFLLSANQNDFHWEGIRLRTYRWPHVNPEAPVVLFLHGWESNAARWRAYIEPAREAGFSVVAFDAPASGQSDGRVLNGLLYSKALKEFLNRYGTPYAIVGHSLGAAAAVFAFTLQQAEPPQKLTLLSSFADSKRVILDFTQVLGANEKVIHAIFQHIERRSGLPIDAFSVTEKVAQLRSIEGLVLHDRQDEVAPVTEGQDIAQNWSAQFLETDGLGHRMQDKVVVQAVLDFIQS